MADLDYKIMSPYKRAHLGVNIDITHRCPLECPACQRQGWAQKGKKVPGQDMSIEEFKKVIEFFPAITFCGQRSDPVHHPKFLEFLKIMYEKKIICGIHNASSAKSEEWYIKAFKAHPYARWVFGIDGMPKDSSKYRINQDGEKLFNIMLMSKQYLKKPPVWQYIIFSYNENDIEEAKRIAEENEIYFLLVHSSRFTQLKETEKTDVINFKPKEMENYVKTDLD